MRLTQDQKVEILAKCEAGFSQATVAKEYGVTQATIWNVVNKKKLKCAGCGSEYFVTPKGAKKKTDYCHQCSSKHTLTGTTRPNNSGVNHSNWRGGEYIDSYGYKQISTNGRHACGKRVYKPEHILVFEQETGQSLQTSNRGIGQQIHHIDGDKLNNIIGNLEFCQNAKDHALLHKQLEEIAFEMVREGLIGFDKKTRTYFRKTTN